MLHKYLLNNSLTLTLVTKLLRLKVVQICNDLFEISDFLFAWYAWSHEKLC